MNLIFERGDRNAPVGHALIYFRAGSGEVLATYVSVPPIAFDLSNYMPPFLAGAMQGMDLGNGMVATPIPPIPEGVASLEYLQALAARRQDDLVYAGGTMQGDPGRLATDAVEAAHAYGELYNALAPVESASPYQEPAAESDDFSGMTEGEQLNELTRSIGRLRDSMSGGAPEAAIEAEVRGLSRLLPPKYRGQDIAESALTPGERGQHLTELYLERSFKLYHEDYLDLERIDNEIEAARE